ncbi:MAG: hypothetical protein ACLQVJ_12680 [Syntrophobacteraceae bacterium]
MLILRHLMKAAKQMRRFGELRPGFLDDCANLKGPPCKSYSRAVKSTEKQRVNRGTKTHSAMVSISVKKEEENGGYRIVDKTQRR